MSYHRCLTCGSLQTEQPWWLPLAYGRDAERFDTGKATRSLMNFFSLPSLLAILGIDRDTPLVDWGGGGGLVARLMRDVGYECYCYDRHFSSEYMTGFQWPDAKPGSPPAITLFEVAEHFENPWEEWQQLFQLQPPLIFGSTEIFANQPADWPYLSPENGQHIFFYSANALGWLAKQFGFSAALIGPYFIFTPQGLRAETCAKLNQWLTNQDVNQLKVFHQWRSTRYANSIKDQQVLRNASAISNGSRKVLIDLVFFQYHRTGIARLWDSLLRYWQQTSFAEHIVLIDRDGTAPRYDKLRSITLSRHQYGARDHDIAQLQHACDAHDAALFLSTYYTRPRTTPSVMLVYDLIPEALRMDLTSPMWQEKADAIAHATKFIAISQSTQSDLFRFYAIDPAAVTVAHCGVDPHFRPAGERDVADFCNRAGLKQPYLLFVGSRDGYKNAGLLLSAMHHLPEAYRFEILFAGGQPHLERQFLPLAEGVAYRICHLSEDDLVLAYAGATALVYPSMYEGFGLPIVEAMGCGCPVVACRTSSIPEIAQENAVYVPPSDPRALATAITRIKEDAALRQRLVAGGLRRSRDFCWALMAEQTRRVIHEFL